MNREVIMTEFVPKPKVNRLPPSPACADAVASSDDSVIQNSLWVFGMLMVAFLGIIAYYQYDDNTVSRHAAVVSSDDRRLMELVNSIDDNGRQGSSKVYIKDNEGIIIGQMVKIASESERVIPDKVALDENNRPAEGELLAILSKY